MKSAVSTATGIKAFEKIGYGLGDFGSNIVFQSIMMLLPVFYTDIFGISPAAMGTMFLFVRLMDAITDPIMGAIADRTESRWGKYRPYLLWSSVPFALLCVACFTTPSLETSGKLVYAYLTYSLLMIAYTAINVPYCALGGVITTDSQERVSLNSYRFVLATLAGVLIASCALPAANYLGGEDRKRGFQLAMAIFSLLAIVSFIGCFFLTKERVRAKSEAQGNLKQDILALLKNDQWFIVVLLFLFLLMPLVLRGGAAAYYMKWFAGREDLVAALLTTGAITQMLGASLASRVSQYFSLAKAYILIQAIIVVGSVAMFFVGKNSLVLIFVMYGVVQFFVQMGAPILFTMTADTVEYGELKTGRRVNGLVFSGALFSLKLGVAVGGTLLGWTLSYWGYQSGESVHSQTPEAIHGIVLAMTLIPALGHLLLIPIASFYRLNRERCTEIREELNKTRNPIKIPE